MDTRFLGDLYQDLSEFARDTYALLQTPEFVEEFILDRTLTPAIETFGLANTTLIDPTCGSGHFLLGGFSRLFEAWRAAEPGGSKRARRAGTGSGDWSGPQSVRGGDCPIPAAGCGAKGEPSSPLG